MKELVLSEKATAANNALTAIIGYDPMKSIFERATRILAVKEWLQDADIGRYLSALQNTASGFQTDKKEGYSGNELAQACLEALTKGLRLTDNEFNIISGRCYITVSGFRRLVAEFHNEKHRMVAMDVIDGEPVVNGSLVKLPMSVEYSLMAIDTGEVTTQLFSRPITIRIRNGNETPDNWIGKATRRILQKLYTKLSGSEILDDDMPSESSSADTFFAKPEVGTATLVKTKVKEELDQADFSEVPPVEEQKKMTEEINQRIKEKSVPVQSPAPAPAAQPAPAVAAAPITTGIKKPRVEVKF